MTGRRPLLTLLFVAWLAVLGGFGWLIAGSQRDGRADLEERFANRVAMAAGQIGSFRDQTPARQRTLARRWLAPVADTPLSGLVDVPLERGQAFLADDAGAVMLASRGASARTLPAAIGREPQGSFAAADGPRRFAQREVPGTPWRVVMTVPEEVLYGALGGLTWLPWAVLAALALAGLVAGRLVVRRAAAERRLARSEALHRDLLRHLPDAAVFAFDGDLRYTLVEGEALAVLGWRPEELVGRRLDEVVPAERLGDLQAHHRAALAGETVRFQWESVRTRRLVEATTCPLRGEDDRVHGGLLVARDVTERQRLEDELRRMADHDPLTGLWNRRRFDEALVQQAARCRRHGERAALLVLDLDHLKQVNDRHGHGVGDRLIRHVASVLDERVRASDAVARLGGDEFAVLLTHVSADEAAHVAAGIAETLRDRPLVLDDGSVILITASIGMAFLDGHNADAEQAMVNADVAMYDAKAAGRNQVSALREPPAGARAAVRVFHADDSEPYRRLLAEMLRAHVDIEIVGEAADGPSAARLAAAARPDVVLFDASLQEEAPDAVERLRRALPGARVLVLSGGERCPDALAGATDGFVPKSSSFDEIAAAVRG